MTGNTLIYAAALGFIGLTAYIIAHRPAGHGGGFNVHLLGGVKGGRRKANRGRRHALPALRGMDDEETPNDIAAEICQTARYLKSDVDSCSGGKMSYLSKDKQESICTSARRLAQMV